MKKILIISADPNSINSELIYKCWKSLDVKKRNKIYLISNYELLKKQFKILKYPIQLIKVNNIEEKVNNKLKIININIKFKDPFNVDIKDSSLFIKKSFDLAHTLALSGKVIGIINCPLDKKLLKTKVFYILYIMTLFSHSIPVIPAW